MNTKTTSYTILALVLGYTIMSIVPSMLTSPMMLIENGATTKGDELLETPQGETLGDNYLGDSTQGRDAGSEAGDTQIYYLIFDVIIAFTVYYLARRRFM
jgi:hypothetical protein